MIRIRKLLLAILTSVLLTCVGCSLSNKTETQDYKNLDYVKSAHYFADEWPVNFWNAELLNIDDDFKQIQSDGFNSIVLVIPWREFQPDINPIQYNERVFEVLDELFTKASEHDLGVILRVGYTWDFYNDADDDVTQRYYKLMYDQQTKKAWLDYSETIYQFANKYNNFIGGFLCWEDFWKNIYTAKDALNTGNGIKMAMESGYQEYLSTHYDLKDINEAYKETFDGFDKVYVPDEKSPAFKYYYEFYDYFLNNLLEKTQEVFPNLSMEVRVDADVVYNEQGKSEIYTHEATYMCGNSDFTTTMYGIPMGFENKGEEISGKEALKMTDYILGNINSVTLNKKLYIDQFIFSDNTPKFSYNTRLKKEEIDNYLSGLDDILVNDSWGYGIWTYRDYLSNMLYNPQFGLDDEGWSVDGSSNIIEDGNTGRCIELSGGTKLSQIVPKLRNHFSDLDTIYVSLDAVVDEPTKLAISVGNETKEVIIDKSGTYQIEFSDSGIYDFTISTEKQIILDNIRLYSQYQEGYLYKSDNSESDYIEDLRKLNKRIDKKVEVLKKNKPYFSFIDNIQEANLSGKIDSNDFPWQTNIGIINVDKIGSCVFMTPGTSIEYNVPLDNKKHYLKFSYGLHPTAQKWNISDGMQFIVKVKEASENDYTILDTILVDPNKTSLVDYKVSLNKYKGKNINIVIIADNKNSMKSEGDWGILSNPVIQ